MTVVKYWKKLPIETVNLHPWRCSRLGLGVGHGDHWRSLPTAVIPWLQIQIYGLQENLSRFRH